MIVSALIFNVVYLQIIYITCAAHVLHCMAEESRGQFISVEKCITNVKNTLESFESVLKIQF